MKQHNPYSAEIHVLAILPEMHRRGIGRQLLQQAECYLRAQGVSIFTSKHSAIRTPMKDM
ncbi:MAG: GNAT family N-acetyltransferase [Caldilineaceae bacterium]